MDTKFRIEKTVAILELSGRFDAFEAPAVAERLEQATRDIVNILVNLAKVDFVDSAALATLVRGMKRCREQGGDLYVCELQKPVRTIFEVTRLDRAFEVFGSTAEAVQAFDRDPVR